MLDPYTRPFNLRLATTDQHFDRHGHLAVRRLIASQPGADFLAHRATICCIERVVHLRDLPDPFFDWRPVVIEAIDGALAPDWFDTDVLETCIAEQPLQQFRISKQPGRREDLTLFLGKEPIQRSAEMSPHGQSV